jgi:hypothetical protein
VPGLFGFSVQHEPGKSIEELAAAGRFPNKQISVTTAEALFNAASRAGYEVALVKSPGKGYHYSVEVPDPLSPDLADALSSVFVQMPNPAPANPP